MAHPMPNGSLEFCDEYGYPPEVKAHFKEILSALDPSKVTAVLLHGSASRGELSYLRDAGGRLNLRSDYEFQVVASGKVDRGDHARLKAEYEAMQRKIEGGSPIFHIDFSYITVKALRRLPRRFINFEKRQAGRVIYGEDILGEIPEVTQDNLDYRELHSVLLWRLWALLLFAPASWVSGSRPTASVIDLYRHVISRNVLDLTTLLLPLEGRLIPSFASRVQYVSEHYQSLSSTWQFVDDLPALLNEALDGKVTGQFASDLDTLYSRAIAAFHDAGRYLLRRECPTACETDVPTHLVKHARTLFQDGYLRFRLYDLYMLGSSRQLRLRRAARWLRVPKLGTITALLYSMHLSLVLHKEGSHREASASLDQAVRLWRRIELREVESPAANSAPFSRQWVELRRRLVETFQWYHYGVREQREHHNRILNYERTIG